MIDRTSFARGFALLMDRFARDFGEPTIAEYRRILDAELDTASFNAAVQVIFRHDQFFPTPQRFVEAVKGDPKQEAVKEWDRLLEAASKGQPGELSEAGKAALRAVGGWSRVAYAQDGSLPALRRSFLDSYGARVSPDALPLPALPGKPS